MKLDHDNILRKTSVTLLGMWRLIGGSRCLQWPLSSTVRLEEVMVLEKILVIVKVQSLDMKKGFEGDLFGL